MIIRPNIISEPFVAPPSQTFAKHSPKAFVVDILNLTYLLFPLPPKNNCIGCKIINIKLPRKTIDIQPTVGHETDVGISFIADFMA